jgi:hypothetical protein
MRGLCTGTIYHGQDNPFKSSKMNLAKIGPITKFSIVVVWLQIAEVTPLETPYKVVR